MCRKFIKKRDVWDFEKELAKSNPQIWSNEAINLKYSAKVLLSYQEEVFDDIFNKKKQPKFPGFWSANVIRMLFSFSLENLIKGILIKKDSSRYFKKEGNISFGKEAHKLCTLFTDADIAVNEEEERYLEIWTTCALFAGRYPIAKNEHGFPNQRVPMKSSEALLKRRLKEIQKSIKQRKQLLPEINDAIHTGVGTKEEEIFDTLFKKLLNEPTFSETQVDAALSDSKKSSPTHNKG